MQISLVSGVGKTVSGGVSGSSICSLRKFTTCTTGTIWEKLFFSWEFLGTFDIGYQYVIKINGNFVGITFFFVGKTIGILTKF